MEEADKLVTECDKTMKMIRWIRQMNFQKKLRRRFGDHQNKNPELSELKNDISTVQYENNLLS